MVRDKNKYIVLQRNVVLLLGIPISVKNVSPFKDIGAMAIKKLW